MRKAMKKIAAVVLMMTLLASTNSIEASAKAKPKWKTAYANYINKHYKTDGGQYFNLIYVNKDKVPELYIQGTSTAEGDLILTAKGKKVRKIYVDNMCGSYVAKKNIIYAPGGRMDVYSDTFYKIKNGKFKKFAQGKYGAENNAKVKYDKDGNPIYNYYWNNVKMSKAQYNAKLAATKKNYVYSAGCGNPYHSSVKYYTRAGILKKLS